MLRDIFGLLRATRGLEVSGENWKIGGDPAQLKAMNSVECSATHSSVTVHQSQDYGYNSSDFCLRWQRDLKTKEKIWFFFSVYSQACGSCI